MGNSPAAQTAPLLMTNEQRTEQKVLMTAAHHSYVVGLNSHAFFKLSNKARSEDLVQDTFVKTWKYLVKGGKIEIMKAFLYHVLNQLIIDQYRKHDTDSLDAMVEKGFDPGIDNSEKLFNMLDGKKALFLIQRLPEKYQKVMRMRFVQELSFKEMSLVTGETKNALAVKVYRGLEKLKLIFNSK
jgi:RNA polymerase sigma-70 factor, ECF subfamily